MRVTTSRQRVLAYLEKRGAATVSDIARDLGMTRANARHHLILLASLGSVEVIGQRRVGRGRPAALYSLSRTLQGDALPVLADALLDDWLSGVDEEERADRLRSLARRLAQGGEPLRGSLVNRLAALVRRLNVLGYRARWEAHAEGPHVVLGHCPYAAVLEKHPELCRMDAFLLEERLGVGVRLIARLRQGEQGAPHCIFVVETY